MKNIEWNKVTKLSQIVAIVLFFVVYAVGFLVGQKYESKMILGKPITKSVFKCDQDKSIKVTFYENFVYLKVAELDAYVPHTISASGARYALPEDALVFWNKGDTAFIEMAGVPVYQNCVIKSD